ncbi:hypothetical protein WG66_003493 [Moniliophthora roreri]|nr:hypothetical protein WG66_003493 [Moniliophthora roreri]
MMATGTSDLFLSNLDWEIFPPFHNDNGDNDNDFDASFLLSLFLPFSSFFFFLFRVLEVMEAALNEARTAFLFSSWLNLTLYTLEICLGVYYFNISKYPWNSFNRLTLTASLLVDTACTAVVCYNVYFVSHFTYSAHSPLLIGLERHEQYLVDFRSKSPFSSFRAASQPDVNEDVNQFIQPWTLPATILLTYTSSLIEQCFYVHRYWKISRNIFMTLIIVVFIVTHVVFGFISGIWTAIRPQIGFSFAVTATTVAAVLCSATDLVIAVCMAWKLKSIRTTYAQTQSLIRRMTIQAVTNGIITSTATIIMLVLLFTTINGRFYVLFASLGRLYTLTVLINFIVLRGSKEETSRVISRTRSTRTRTATAGDPVAMTPIGEFSSEEGMRAEANGSLVFHSFTVPDLDSEQVSSENVELDEYTSSSGAASMERFKSQTTRTGTGTGNEFII